MEYFTLSAVPNSQMWHQSADQVVSTAPIVYRRLERQLISAKVTVIGEWLTECNQGGSILFVSHQSEHGSFSLAVTSCEWIEGQIGKFCFSIHHIYGAFGCQAAMGE
jgi:hypothetical protein